MNNQETIPCKQCPCLPVCRHKYFGPLCDECSIIEKYIGKRQTDSNGISHVVINSKKIMPLYKQMKPLAWKLTHPPSNIIENDLTYHEQRP